MTPLAWSFLLLGAPALAAASAGLIPPLRRSRAMAFVALAAAAASLVAAIMLFVTWLGAPGGAEHATIPWLVAHGRVIAEMGVRLDGVTASMLLVVTSVAFCVQLFSVGYMADEPAPAFGRYFTYHSLFLLAMSILVVAPNLLQLFIGWELVGVTSYLLIGFYFKKPSAARAATKAFWITKLADLAFIVALLSMYATTGGFSFEATLPAGWAIAITLMLFIAVAGKSAQFPLHVWLPDAMEGPTPVSALLHAATMVAAGVFLVVRADPLFAQAPETRELVVYVGALTAFFAASVALVQQDIKKMLAYSTCSQLGYMLAALGAGSLLGGFFHLTTHAFFKALLFLSAGSAIHAVHSNLMGDMVGLGRKLRVTGFAFLVGGLALAGVPGMSGFISKELVLEAVASRGLVVPLVVLMASVFLTSLYVGRALLVLFGKPAEAHGHAHGHALHEAGPSMLGPLLLLAVPSLGLGFFAGPFATLWGARYEFHFGATSAAAVGLALFGFLFAWLAFGGKRSLAGVVDAFAPLGRLARSAAVDRLYVIAFRRVLMTTAAALAWVDRYIIDGLMNALGVGVLASGRALRKVQTGDVQDYVFAVAAGVILLALWGILP